jgi:metallo-beta-lactamase family protein
VPPESIDAVVLTHAHIDHCGYLPRLVRLGFRGRAYGTTGTGKLLAIVLPDSGHLQEEDAAYANRRGYSKHAPALPLYTEQDALASLEVFEPVEFGATVDVLVLESTYGDRLHPDTDPGVLIEQVVNEVARRGGVVVIPAFAVDRTEVVLWHLDRLVGAGRVPDLPVFVDSPMACRALDVYRAEAARGSAEFRPEYLGANLFPSLWLREVRTVEESKELNDRRGPAIIISASGMATGGRVLHHLAHRLGDDRNAVLLVGFQAPGTRGDALRQGVRQVKMLGRYHQVRAAVSSIELSSHADQGALVRWATTATTTPTTVFVNHGEAAASAALAAALGEHDGLMAVCPRPGERVGLDV